ncbi:heme-binding protein [Bradyrhizobium sp. 192]|nr:heme-binding protein [Bradyrhizobium sp. 192]
MNSRRLTVATALVIASICPLRAEENLGAYKSLTPGLAFDLARAALNSCRSLAFQVAVAVVDRFGVTQVMLRDRFAGPHTPPTATGKAWTAASFRTSTTELNAISQPGMMQSGIRDLPGVVIIGGGLVVEANGSLVAAVSVSGAPGGDADEACARAGIDAIRDRLDFRPEQVSGSCARIGTRRSKNRSPQRAFSVRF